MIELLKRELKTHKALNTVNLYPLLIQLANVLPDVSTPMKMKLTLAVNELILFASQFRKNIQHWNGSKIPINSISFVINKSGSNKDKSINLLRKTFAKGYEILNKKRIELNIAKAKSIAIQKHNSDENYKKYFIYPTPLFVAPSTNEGFIQHLNELDEEGIGSGFIYTGYN